MTKRTERSRTFRPPLSGRALGFCARRLGLEVARGDRTASRYFNGSQVSEKARQKIISALALDLMEQGIFPRLRVPNYNERIFAKKLGEALAVIAGEWDALAGRMRGETASVDRPDLARAAYLRLIAVDLSVRYAGLLCLARLPAPTEETPLWVDGQGGMLYLRSLLERCGGSAPSRATLAEALEVSMNTIDSWLDSGVRPRDYHLEGLGEVLAPTLGSASAQSVAGGLRLHYGLSEMCAELAAHVGREAVVETARAMVRFTARSHADMSALGSSSVNVEAALFQVLALLGGARGMAGLVSKLAEQEEDPLWRTELISSGQPWDSRLRFVMKALSDTDKAAKLARQRHGIPEEFAESIMDDVLRSVQSAPSMSGPLSPDAEVYRVSGDARFSAANRLLQYEEATALGDVNTALVHIRRAVELQPENSMYHFLLGTALASVGDTEDALQECRIANSLDPNDELPRVEVGIILMNAGRDQEARDHLEELALGQDDLSAHLSFNLGMARFRCRAYREALEALEVSLRLRPDYGMALDAASQCAFEIGDAAKGRELAKKALRHGETEAYEKWRSKEYRRYRR